VARQASFNRFKTAWEAAGLQNDKLVDAKSKPQALAQIARHETDPAAAGQTASLVRSPGFQNASEATRSALLAAQDQHSGDSAFSKGLESLAGSDAFKGLGSNPAERDAAQAKAIQAFHQVANSPAYKGATDEAKGHILGNTAKAVTSEGFQKAKPEVQTAMFNAVQNHATDDKATDNIVALANSEGFKKASEQSQKDLLAAADKHAGDGIYTQGLQNLARGLKGTPEQQKASIDAFDRAAGSTAYQDKSVTEADKKHILNNTAKAVTSDGFINATPDVRTAMFNAVQKHATDDAATNNIVALANSQDFQALSANPATQETQKKLLAAADSHATDAAFVQGLQNLAANRDFKALTPAQQADAIQQLDNFANRPAYAGSAVSNADRQQILGNLTRIVTSPRYQNASPAMRSGIIDALDITGMGTIPPTLQDAPTQIDVSALQPGFDREWANSFPGGRSHEQGGTLVSNKAGDVKMIHPGGLPGQSTSGSFRPDLSAGPDEKLLGIFHTHPYDSTEGGFTGVSLSGGDAGYLINKAQNAIIAQSGNEQFMYLRTGATPSHVDWTAVNNAQNQRVQQLTAHGLSFSAASKAAAKEAAQTYGLAYYEGTNGVFTRVYP
jgi:Arc/MetJ-type ribon-helix-helix transcriptional regulator